MTKNEVMQYLITEFNKNGFKEVCIDTPSGKCWVNPCSYSECPVDINEVEFFLVEGPIPWLGGSDFNKVCEDIANMDTLIKDLELEKEELNNYFEKYHDTDEFDYDWYSDWHKDLYGFRPRGSRPGEYVAVNYSS